MLRASWLQAPPLSRCRPRSCSMRGPRPAPPACCMRSAVRVRKLRSRRPRAWPGQAMKVCVFACLQGAYVCVCMCVCPEYCIVCSVQALAHSWLAKPGDQGTQACAPMHEYTHVRACVVLPLQAGECRHPHTAD